MTPEEIAAEAAKAAKAAEEAKLDALAKKVAAEIMEKSKGHREPGNVFTQPADPAKADVQVGKHMTEGSGLNLVRYVKAKAVAKMDGRSTIEVLKGWGDEVVSKALSQSSFGDGGSLVHPQFASDFIELLRNEAVVRKAGPNTIQMTGASLTFDGQTSAATAGYGAEAAAITESQPGTGQPLVLSEKKLRALVPVTNDLLRNPSVGAETMIRNDLLRVMALTEDTAFFYGAGTVHEPRGMKNWLHADHRYAMTALTAAGVPTVGEIKKELNKAKKRLKKSNAPMRKCVWFLSPSTEAAILNAVGPGGEGYNVFEREMTERGTLAGFPFFVTNQIPETSTTDLFLFDMSEVIVADSLALEMEIFLNGAFNVSGSVVSGISTDQSVIRAIAKHDIGVRHSVFGVHVSGMTWGI